MQTYFILIIEIFIFFIICYTYLKTIKSLKYNLFLTSFLLLLTYFLYSYLFDEILRLLKLRNLIIHNPIMGFIGVFQYLALFVLIVYSFIKMKK